MKSYLGTVGIVWLQINHSLYYTEHIEAHSITPVPMTSYYTNSVIDKWCI